MRRNFLRSWFYGLDQKLLMCIFILLSISLLLVATSSSPLAARIGLTASYFIVRQAIYILMFILVLISLSFCNPAMIKKIGFIGTALSLILLLLVLIRGHEINGARRWISFMGTSIQPSEFLKPFLWISSGHIISLIRSYASSMQDGIKIFFNFQRPKTDLELRVGYLIIFLTLLYLLVAFLLVLEPDFGTTVIIFLILGVQIFVAGIPIIYIILSIILSTIAVILAYLSLPHVHTRINNFLDNQSIGNYQVNKSIEALINGGLYGKGPEEGTIKRNLPDSHTDFIFAVAGEEFGILMCLFINSIFAFMAVRVLCKLLQEKDFFKITVVSAIISQVAFQSIINMGVSLNLFPTKGMTLPMISYGGSAILSVAINMGVLLSLSKTTPYDIYEKIRNRKNKP